LFFTGFIAVVTLTIIFKADWLTIICSILGIFTVFTQAKGKIATQFIGAVYFGFYVFLAWQNSYFGEVAVYAGLIIPMYIYGIIHWLRNRDKNNNAIMVRKNLPKAEWIILVLSLVGLSFGFYFLLQYFGTAQLIFSTVSVILSILAVYLLARRIKYNQIAFFINDFILGTLWLLVILNGDLTLIPFLVMCLFFIVYDLYGLIQWTKLEKKQKGLLPL